MSSPAHRLALWFRLLLACFALAGAAPAPSAPIVDAVELRAASVRKLHEVRESRRASPTIATGGLATVEHDRAAASVRLPRPEPWRPWMETRLFVTQRALLV